MTKNEIRDLMKKKRAEETHGAEKSSKICNFLQSSPLFQKSRRILFFASFKNEPDILPLAEKILTKREIFFPKILDSKSGKMEAVRVQSLGELKPLDFGILAPESNNIFPPEDLDLILVPALAVDVLGNRIGFGRGFYDRFLERTSAISMGVVFDFQIFPQIPTEKWDKKMDGFVSEKEFFSHSQDC